jgi:transposase-like protein
LAINRSLHDPKEMLAERGLSVDHTGSGFPAGRYNQRSQ